MKKFIKRVLPGKLKDFISKIKYQTNNSKFKGFDPEDIFSEIYKTNHWGCIESKSGIGSSVDVAENIIKNLKTVLIKLDIKTILDIPCGDFNWMNQVDLTELNYIGADIVSELIIENSKKFERGNVKFKHIDLIRDILPKADIVLCRDSLVHFSYDHIFKSLDNIKRSNSKYLMTTSFLKQSLNYNINTGDWRPLNLEKPPFNFPKPIMFVEEFNETGFRKESKHKILAVWKIKDL